MRLKLKSFLHNYRPSASYIRGFITDLSKTVKAAKFLGFNWSRMRRSAKLGLSRNKYTKRKIKGFKI